jgi:hypothetical protein
MARGQQKIQSQQKNAEKAAKMKKAQGHDQKKAAQAALTYKCSVCMVNIITDQIAQCVETQIWRWDYKTNSIFWSNFYCGVHVDLPISFCAK